MADNVLSFYSCGGTSMPSRIQFGWTLPSSPGTQASREAFLTSVNQGFELVKGHFDSAWIIDHLQTQAHPLLEGWTALTYFAVLQPEFDFGHTVLCQSFRNPALLAKMSATLQYLSGGRFILGLGTGWLESEYQAYNYPFPPPGQRLQELEETVRIVKALWQEKQATVEGKHYTVHAAYCEPKPDPLPPIMIGGAKPRILRLIARHADWWDVSGFGVGLDRYRTCVEEMERACAEVGRDPATLRRTYSTGWVVRPNEAEA